jgi:hypothetical protein
VGGRLACRGRTGILPGHYCYSAAVNESLRISDNRLATTHAILPAFAFVALFVLTDLDQVIARLWPVAPA